ncbi:3018_t:CDS:2 [Entrophospora sp. SA101]|nr:3018_t:CDS:2 [Entrophospora sp. SA101]
MTIQEISDPPKIKSLSFPIKNTFKLFRNACNVTLDFENKYFENKIELIKNRREEFQSIANGTIQQSDELAKFGGDLMVLIKHCGDKAASKEDILNYLNRLLNDATTNKIAIKETNSKIITLKLLEKQVSMP